MTAPYRTSSPPAEPPPPLWQRAVFRAWPELAAEVWQWARKRMGGRRSMAPHRQPGWVRVDRCRCSWPAFGLLPRCECEVWPRGDADRRVVEGHAEEAAARVGEALGMPRGKPPWVA